MKITRGKVLNTRHTLTVTGGANDSGVSTKHHAIFSLDDGTTVIYNSGVPAVIGDGDQVIVAGRERGRLMHADAYWNLTAHVRGNAGCWTSFAGAAFTFPFGVASLIIAIFAPASWIGFQPDFSERLIAFALGLFFNGVGIYYLYRWLCIHNAVKMLEKSY